MKRYMPLKKLLIPLLIIFFFPLIFYCCKSPTKSNDNILKIHFINVGQGDSTLITFNNNNLLIDAGSNFISTSTINYIKKQGIKRLHHVIATHPHEDHIGAMEKIINNFEVDNFYAPTVSANTTEFKSMIKALKKNNLKIIEATFNKKINFNDKIKCEFLAPCSNSYNNLNNYSAVVKLTYKKCSFIFTGDAEKISEDEMICTNSDLNCDVLKVGHHGSKTSSSEKFLDATNPSIAIISCGYKNRYGHPNKIILKRLSERNIKIFRTDIHGNILFNCNGYDIKRIINKSSYL